MSSRKIKECYRISCKLHPCKETARIIKFQDIKTSCHIPAGGQVSVKCNMDRVVFEEKIPVAFEPELFENEDLIPISSI